MNQDNYSPNKDDQQGSRINPISGGQQRVAVKLEADHTQFQPPSGQHLIQYQQNPNQQIQQQFHMMQLQTQLQTHPQIHPHPHIIQPHPQQDYMLALLFINQSHPIHGQNHPQMHTVTPNQDIVQNQKSFSYQKDSQEQNLTQLQLQQRHIHNYNQQMQLQFEQIQAQQHRQQHLQQHPQLNTQTFQQQPQQTSSYQPQTHQPLRRQKHERKPLDQAMQYQMNPYINQEATGLQGVNPLFMSFIQHKKLVHTSPNKVPLRSRTPDNLQVIQPPTSTTRKRHRRSESMNTEDLDVELKQLAFKASELPLSELALKIKAVENDDRIPESSNIALEAASISEQDVGIGIGNKFTSKERQRQIFGMVWLLGACESSATAVVPRNRIYARYVQVCADNSLKPLSPASFGKLVRIFFPNITTRRLGMRGQSKYHYCGIKLVGDNSFQNASSQSPVSSASSPYANATATGGVGGGFDSPHSIPERAITPTNFQSYGSPITIGTTSYSNLSTPAAAAVSTTIQSTDYLQFGFHYEYQQKSLKYVPDLFNLIDKSLAEYNSHKSQIKLPSIYPYLPKDTDYDIADTLYSLYRVHCTTIFESLRFMQTKNLFSAFSNFIVILTNPVSRLYISDSIYHWVKACDSEMYRAMTKMLTKLHLQNVPQDVLGNLKLIASQYIEKLSTSLQNKVPKNFYIMKLVEAQKFVKLLKRLIQVIETGQSATRILNNPSERQSMVQDWLRLDMPEIILREVPCSNDNLQTLLHIFQHEFLPLLKATSVNNELQSFKHSLGETGEDGNVDFHTMNTSSTSPTLAPISDFIAILPSRFNRVNARLFLLVTSNLLTTCLREISLGGGQGFGAWWVVRCWVDEYLTWYFELGGMLQDEFIDGGLAKPANRQSQPFEQSQTDQSKQGNDENAMSTSTQEGDRGSITTQQEMQLQIQQQQYSEPQPKNIFDLLDDSYGFEKVEDSAEGILDYSNVGMERLLSKGDDLLDLQ